MHCARREVIAFSRRWRRASWCELTLVGHEVRLMPAKDVRAYVKPMRRRDLRGGSPANDADLCM